MVAVVLFLVGVFIFVDVAIGVGIGRGVATERGFVCGGDTLDFRIVRREEEDESVVR